MESDSDDELFENPRLRLRKPRRFLPRREYDHLTEEEFQERFRFSREGVEKLLERLGPDIHPVTKRTYALSGRQRLLIALRFYASGINCYSNGDCQGPSKNSCSRHVRFVTDLILRLVPTVIRWPENAQDRRKIAEKFHRIAHFPSVCGCVDGTLIQLKAPKNRNIEMQFVDRHGNHSINCMAVCGPRYVN